MQKNEEIITMEKSLWRNKSFLVLMSTALIVGFGQKVYGVILPLIVYHMTGSSKMMGIMRAIEFLPNLLFALFIGIWIERFDKKIWSVSTLFLQSLFLLLVYVVLMTNGDHIYFLYLLVFLISTCSYCYYISQNLILKQSIDACHINLATARLSGVNNFFDTIGPVISGVALFFVSLKAPIVVLVLLFALATFFYFKTKMARNDTLYKKTHD